MRKAVLIIRYKASDGVWRRALVARAANGRIKPAHALIDGQAKQVEEYQYQVRYFENRCARYVSSGTSATDAENLRRRIEQKTTVVAEARKAGIRIEPDSERLLLGKSAAAYFKDAEDRGATEAAAQARQVTDEFLRVVKKTYVDEVTRDDVFRFQAALRKRGCGDRTVSNKHQRLVSWLRFAGVDRSILPPAPKYEEKLPTIYSRDEISTLLAEADSYMRIAILLGLKCGLRDQELMHAEFSDINWGEKTFRVQGKARWNFHVKTHEQREIPITHDVLKELRKWKQKSGNHLLILATKRSRPNTKLLLSLKRLARRAGLNCGRCDGCKSSNRECKEFTLHKLRRTYITTLLRNGVDLRTVQAYAGHKDIASTMRYLRPASAREAQEKLNAIKW